MWARQLEMIAFMGSRLETGSVLWRCIEYFKEQTKCKMEKCSIEVESERMDGWFCGVHVTRIVSSTAH